MKYRDIRACIVLIAGLVTLIVNMKTGKNVMMSLITVLIVILVFYVLGTLIIEILQKSLEQNDATEQQISIEVSEEGTDEVLEEEVGEENSAQVSFDDEDDE